MRMRSIVAGIALMQLAVFSAQAQTGPVNIATTAVPFLRISPDARAGGMGDVGIATAPDVNAGYWNLAKTPFIANNTSVALTYTPWLKDLGLNDVYLASLTAFHKLDDEQAISANVRYFSLGNIQFTDISGNTLSSFNPREFGIDFGYSRKLNDQLSIGVALRYIYSSLANGDPNNSGVVYKAGTSVAGDISLFHTSGTSDGSGLNWGITLSNLGAKIGYTNDAQNKDFIPANLGAGICYTTVFDESSKLSFGLDVNKLLVPVAPTLSGNTSQDSANIADYRTQSVMKSWLKSFNDGTGVLSSFQASLGAEYAYNNQFFVRAGYFYEDKNRGNRKYFTGGVGFKYDVYTINFSYLVPSGNGITRNPLSNTIRVGIAFDLDKKQ
ncbi:MAG: type IX secretion system outer membrane channel protein PorV [Bacteroidota bacterium]|nr:type IX secretion system outer membrane channel protein PorV [Bacteroidota bacterium]